MRVVTGYIINLLTKSLVTWTALGSVYSKFLPHDPFHGGPKEEPTDSEVSPLERALTQATQEIVSPEVHQVIQ